MTFVLDCAWISAQISEILLIVEDFHAEGVFKIIRSAMPCVHPDKLDKPGGFFAWWFIEMGVTQEQACEIE